MINSFNTYKLYLNEDKIALGIKNNPWVLFSPFNIDLEIWKFQKALRRCEYLYNLDKRNIIWKIRKLFAAYRFKNLSCKLGYTIPINCFGPGLRILHRGTIVINGQCRIGANCTINACVNIGTKAGYLDQVPNLGKNIYIGPGAKIYGKITIADGCAIGANAVVNKSFNTPNSIIIGVPAFQNGLLNRNLNII